ncbi:recombinase [Streptomyces sp. SLBN-118]|uniref:recombinase family protein n=1 Tax=Streptomyces sp. SLBN-118 TaxID=2768454 RepID=UPI0011696BDA|nr:recombinase family protein [Streptomyces sp. SLBN-118]TQK45077.1 recombinase [Streptomyces sp. SLBN-118]
MEERPIRAAIYLRLSRDNRGSTSIASQREDCRAVCKSRGWDVVTEVEDVDISGSLPVDARPALRSIFAELDRFDVLLVAQPDRLARSTAVALSLLQNLDAAGKSLATARDLLDSATPDGRRKILSAVADAEGESSLIQARIRRSRASLREAERWIGGNAPYGYRIIGDTNGGKRLALHEKAADRMRWIVGQILEGETVTAVCHALNSAGVPSPGTVSSRTGKVSPWSPTVLRRMLQSPALLGRRTIGSGRDRRAVVDAAGRPVSVGPPLIDVETWDSLQTTLAARRTTAQRPRLHSSLLLHIAHRAECGSPLHYNSRRLLHGGGANDVYRCATGCKVLISAVRLEEAVQRRVLGEFGELPFIARIPVALGQPDEHVDQLRAEVEELAGRLANLRGLAADAVQRQLESRASLLEKLQSAAPIPWDWTSTGISVSEEWEVRGVGGRRQILVDLGVRVAVSPANNQRRWTPDRLHISATGPGPLLARAVG